MNDFLCGLKRGLKNPKALIIIGVFGIFLIGVSSFFGGDKKETEAVKSSVNFSEEEYCEDLENKVKRIVSDITGDKKPTVVVTLKSGIKYSYADSLKEDDESRTNEKSEEKSKSSSKTYITVKSSDGGEEPLIVTYAMPEIRGVAVICDGGDDEVTNEKIKNAVTAAFNITSKRVFITGGTTYEKG